MRQDGETRKGVRRLQLSTKDLHYLKDELSWELLAMKKCHHYAQECQDPEIRQLLDRIGKIHQQHYQILLNQLNPSGQPTMQSPAGTQSTYPASCWGNMQS
jgi:hypothetical protein|nr:hypothetical protein [Planifilum fimeticola]